MPRLLHGPVAARLAIVLTALALSAATATAQEIDSSAARIERQVREMANGGDIEVRRAAIVARLERLGLAPNLVWFDPPAAARVDRRGANVVATIPGGGAELLMLGAHYDAFDRAQGVIDNAAGVAAVLELAETFVRRPLRHFSVVVAFFDLEEDGRIGSRALVADSARVPLPSLYLNFDIFGYGRAFWVGARNASDPLPQELRRSGTSMGLHVVVDSMYPSSDHASFRTTNTTAYAISLLDSADVHTLLARFRRRDANRGETPKIFRIMHTTEDTLDELEPAAVARGVAAVEEALRRLDAARAPRDATGD